MASTRIRRRGLAMQRAEDADAPTARHGWDDDEDEVEEWDDEEYEDDDDDVDELGEGDDDPFDDAFTDDDD